MESEKMDQLNGPRARKTHNSWTVAGCVRSLDVSELTVLTVGLKIDFKSSAGRSRMCYFGIPAVSEWKSVQN